MKLYLLSLSALFLLNGCVTQTNSSVYSDYEFTGARTIIYRANNNIGCCKSVSRKIRVSGESGSLLVLRKYKDNNKYYDYLHIDEKNLIELIDYLTSQYLLEGVSEQRAIRLGSTNWKTGTYLEGSRQITYFLTLKSDFAFHKADILKILTLLREVEHSLLNESHITSKACG
jgi:hypothetical protein|tara:strand:- start:60 stop:575 length:516 start_codon:yes stop_codon:yes gene_type:complete